MLQKRTLPSAVETRLGWELGRLEDLLEGRARLGFDELLEVLPVLDVTPGEFFAGLYGFEPGDSGTAVGEMIAETTRDSANGFRQRVLDRRFEESRKVVREAVARRLAWKQQRAELGDRVSPGARPEPVTGPRKDD
ncbi:MAG TPA: hypothetical protein VL025_06145 [Thermoanaerobaculia bacterium]|nr:hypothetical protein [Thermoanaerobaculia bacterium]